MIKLLHEYINNIILEGRVEDVKKKYPDYSSVVDNLSEFDPSGNNKYLMWMVDQFENDEDIGNIKDVVSSFHKNIQRLKSSEKDINSYKTLQDLRGVLNKLDDKSKTQTKKEIKHREADIVFENENVIVVEPKSHKASCYYGSGTKWCTTEKESYNWDKYIFDNNVTFYYILNKKLDKSEALYKVAVAVYPDGEKEAYDSLDNLRTLDNYFRSIGVPEDIFINKLKNGLYVNSTEGDKYWYKDGEFSRENGPAMEHSNGAKEWYLNGERHRENGPAIEYPRGSKEWWNHGVLHRKNGPAIERINGDKEWYLNGKRHRINGPAIEYADGYKAWFLYGQKHREDGPAMELSNGNKYWYLNGKLHRKDGPAVEYANGGKSYYLYGSLFAKDNWERKVKELKNKGKKNETNKK